MNLCKVNSTKGKLHDYRYSSMPEPSFVKLNMFSSHMLYVVPHGLVLRLLQALVYVVFQTAAVVVCSPCQCS